MALLTFLLRPQSSLSQARQPQTAQKFAVLLFHSIDRGDIAVNSRIQDFYQSTYDLGTDGWIQLLWLGHGLNPVRKRNVIWGLQHE